MLHKYLDFGGWKKANNAQVETARIRPEGRGRATKKSSMIEIIALDEQLSRSKRHATNGEGFM